MSAADNKTDVIIVGAGFAGITVARELHHAGIKTVTLEARDRIGGRTWYTEYAGQPFELGGAYVHWLQPHLWAELTRYGLQIVPGTENDVTEVRLLSDSDLHVYDVEAGYGLIAEAYAALYNAEPQPDVVFPMPYQPFNDDTWLAYQSISLEMQVEGLTLSPIHQNMLRAMLATDMSAPSGNAALVEMLRLRALIGSDDFAKLAEVTGTFMIDGGTPALLDKMLTDSQTDLQMNKIVTHISRGETGVEVTTQDGTRYTAKAVIVTTPLNTWGDIAFEPPLDPAKQRLASQRHAGAGFKCFVRVAGIIDGLMAIAPDPHPFSLLTTGFTDDQGTWLIGFGPAAPSDLSVDWAQQGVDALIPGVQVLDVFGHNWTTDPLAVGTWANLRPGQAKWLADAIQPQGCLFFASADIAIGWRGYIDGAIESGLRASRQACHLLGG